MSREPRDFYRTPAHAIRALLEVEDFQGRIWEPACGDGAISRVLEAADYSVASTDLFDFGYGLAGCDFLRTVSPLAPNIVTNPPFSLAFDFVRHAQTLGVTKSAFLLRLSFLESQRRKAWLEESPLKRVWVFSRRLTIWRGDQPRRGSGTTAYAWFVWQDGWTRAPEIGWV